MLDRAAVVAEARRWLGTPFHHQAHLLGVGCDCAGLLRGVLISLGLMPSDVSLWPNAAAFAGYERIPHGDSLLRACDTFMDRKAGHAEPGNAVLLRWRDSDPHHLGIVGDHPNGLSLIHADSRHHKKVIETRLQFSVYMRLVQVYRIRGVD